MTWIRGLHGLRIHGLRIHGWIKDVSLIYAWADVI